MAEYDGLLLDHDGVIVTLVDESALYEAARRAFLDSGVDPKEADVETLSIRVSPSELSDVAETYDLDPDQLWKHRDDRIETTLRAETTAGRKHPYGDVDALGAVSVPIGVVSNNQTRIVEFVLDQYGLADRFGTIRAREPTVESLHRKKPNPEFLEAAMADLGVSNPLYVGDSESDVVAGKRAGLDVAFLRRDHNARVDLGVEPTYDVRSLTTVVELL
ncbi:MAG: HAD-IA family hydrolase [Natronomonas sp.]